MSFIKDLELSKSGDSGFVKRLFMKNLFTLKTPSSFVKHMRGVSQDNSNNLLFPSDILS